MGKLGVRIVKDYYPDHYQMEKIKVIGKSPFMKAGTLNQHPGEGKEPEGDQKEPVCVAALKTFTFS